MESQIIFQLLTMAFYVLNGVLMISVDSMPISLRPFPFLDLFFYPSLFLLFLFLFPIQTLSLFGHPNLWLYFHFHHHCCAPCCLQKKICFCSHRIYPFLFLSINSPMLLALCGICYDFHGSFKCRHFPGV